jgi:hypothetical protein
MPQFKVNTERIDTQDPINQNFANRSKTEICHCCGGDWGSWSPCPNKCTIGLMRTRYDGDLPCQTCPNSGRPGYIAVKSCSSPACNQGWIMPCERCKGKKYIRCLQCAEKWRACTHCSLRYEALVQGRFVQQLQQCPYCVWNGFRNGHIPETCSACAAQHGYVRCPSCL